MKTVEYLELLKQKKGLKSNYAAAKFLGLRQTTLSNYSLGKNFFSDEVAIKIANELGIPEGVVLADVHAERETDPAVKNAWEQIAHALQSMAAAVFIVALLGISTHNAEAGQLNNNQNSVVQNIHYANRKRRKNLLKKFADFLFSVPLRGYFAQNVCVLIWV